MRSLVLFSLILSDLAFAQTVAILDFKDESLPPSVIAPTTIRKLFVDLFPPEEFTLIDRDLVQKIVPPITQEALGKITSSMANMLGQILGADILVIGKYKELRNNGSILVNTSFIDTSRSKLNEKIGHEIMDLFEATFTREGLIEAVSDKIIILNIGSFHGVQIGDEFIVMRGDYQVGKIKVSRVERYMSEAIALSDEAVQVGDMIRRSPSNKLITPLRGALIISSTPSGSSITLNGEPRGLTPLIIFNPEPKAYTISLIREGYHTLQEEVLFEENRSSFLDITIVLARLKESDYLPSSKASRIIVTSSPSNAKVYLNGRLKGITPITLTDLPAGLFTLRVAKAGYSSVSKEVILKEQEDKIINLNLEPITPLKGERLKRRPIPPPPEIFQLQTPYAQNKGGLFIALKYPEIFAARFGFFLDGLELRLQGIGVGFKYQLKQIKERCAFDIYYSTHDFRHNKDLSSLDLRGILSMPFDSGFGMVNLIGGLGYRMSNDGFHYFGGFDHYLTSKLKLLFEYDTIDGWLGGIRYDLPKDLRFSFGAGNELDGTLQLALSLSIQR